MDRQGHPRRERAPRGPFVPVECSGLTESLFESELFGHGKGAFTGAQHRKQGLVEAARGGTLFLDEAGDIPPALQVGLLRLLETRTFRPVGSVETRKADFRVVCASGLRHPPGSRDSRDRRAFPGRSVLPVGGSTPISRMEKTLRSYLSKGYDP